MKLLLTFALHLGLLCLAGLCPAAEANAPEEPREPKAPPAGKAAEEAPAAASAAASDGWHMEEFTCPIDGTQWKQRIEGRGKPAGLRLDLKQVGDVIQPPSVPHCPTCGMVLFAASLPEATVARLKPFIQGADYQMLAAKSPVYADLAQIQDFLGAPPIYPAYSYLRASWEVEGKEAMNKRYLEKALVYFKRALGGMVKTDKEWRNIALLCGELERRLGQWEAAEARFRELGAPEEVKEEPRIAPVVGRQLQLIAARDSLPHILAELPQANVKSGKQLELALKPIDVPTRRAKPRLKPSDMDQSLVMNVEEPPLPQPSRRIRVGPNSPPPPGQPVEAAPSTQTAPLVIRSTTPAPPPAVDAQSNPPPPAHAAPVANVPPDDDEREPSATKFPDLDELPPTKTGARHKAEIASSKALPGKKIELAEKRTPPKAKPAAAVLAPVGETKSRPKLIGAP